MKFGGTSYLASMFGRSMVSAAASSMQQSMSMRQDRVNWEDFNYPPGLRVIHFNILDVEDDACRCTVRWVHASYLFASLTLCFNLLAALVLASGGVPKKGLDVLFSFFNLLLFGVFGCYAFYMAYKGLATQNKRLCYQYLIIQGFLLVFMLASALAGGANFNGWTNLSRAADAGELSGFWTVWTYLEASLWTLNVVVCVVGMHGVWLNKKSGRPLSWSDNAAAQAQAQTQT